MAQKTKKIIILDHPSGCRLANQLWNYISVYAYCLEKGYKCKNYSFFENKKQPNQPNSIKTYYNFFNIPHSNLIKFMLWVHVNISKINKRPRLYYRYVKIIKKNNNKQTIYSQEGEPFYLPPTNNQNNEQLKQIHDIENNKHKIKYLDGWLFRNPVGIKKYHKQIVEYFKPNKHISKYINNLIKPIKERHKQIVGVHIRQSDYKKLFDNGKRYFNELEVRKILNEYIEFANIDKEKIIFLICSDEKINKSYFKGLNFISCEGNEAEDLFTLSACDVIIGAKSTFGPWASYYGNIPFIVFERKMDWNYYKNKNLNKYFENNKCIV